MDCISIAEAKYMGGYCIWLRFNTGETGEVDLKEIIFSFKAAEPLRDPDRFADFHLDSWPTLVWDCGFDVAPESLYRWLLNSETRRHTWRNSQYGISSYAKRTGKLS